MQRVVVPGGEGGASRARVAFGVVLALAALSGCAIGSARDVCAAPGDCEDAEVPMEDAYVPPDDAGPTLERCPAGSAMTGLVAGAPACAPLAPAITAYAHSSCSVYLGWRKDCDGCASAPEKWGHAGGDSCENGAGSNGTCTTPMLGESTVSLYGLNTDEDVEDDDKLYAGFRCEGTTASSVVPASCATDEFVVGVEGDGMLRCAPVAVAAAPAMNAGCALTFGWRDDCEGCTDAPSKWGRTNDAVCTDGAGVGGSCTQPTLGSVPVRLYGLDIDGDFDENDQLYVGFGCTGGLASEVTTDGACPDGTLAVGAWTDGRLVCASPAATVEAAVDSACHVYLGWSDGCDGCTTPPTKWGHVSGLGACESGAGANGVCIAPDLGGAPVPLYGLSTAGDVDGNDTFYVGFRCQ